MLSNLFRQLAVFLPSVRGCDLVTLRYDIYLTRLLIGCEMFSAYVRYIRRTNQRVLQAVYPILAGRTRIHILFFAHPGTLRCKASKGDDEEDDVIRTRAVVVTILTKRESCS